MLFSIVLCGHSEEMAGFKLNILYKFAACFEFFFVKRGGNGKNLYAIYIGQYFPCASSA